MTPLAVAVILACIVALTVVLISMLISFKRAAQRAEGVLAIVEREIRPMTTELENLTAELQKLTHKANDSLDRRRGGGEARGRGVPHPAQAPALNDRAAKRRRP